MADLLQQAADYGLSPKQAYSRLKNPLKVQVRDSLIAEQGDLCAYCMCKIPRSNVDPEIEPIIIEHMVPRAPADHRDSGQGLDYNNLFAVCHGNRGRHETRTSADLTCDAYKGNSEFKKINPCKADTLSSIFYTIDGKIDAIDLDIKRDLCDILNLNCPTSSLIAERKAALDSLIFEIANNKTQLLSYCISILEVFRAEKRPKTPYVGILLWYIQTTIEALNSTQ